MSQASFRVFGHSALLGSSKIKCITTAFEAPKARPKASSTPLRLVQSALAVVHSRALSFSLHENAHDDGKEKSGSSLCLSIKLPGSIAAELLRVPSAEAERVGDLKKAIKTEFKNLFAGIDPNEMQLFKLDGSSRTLLNAVQTLIDADVNSGTALSVELAVPAPAVLPAPVHFKEVEVAPGEHMFVAALPSGPFFLYPQQFRVLQHFVVRHLEPSIPKLLSLVGPVKSGKSAVLFNVLPGLLAAQHAVAGGPTPVIFRHAFDHKEAPGAAAMRLLERAAFFAKSLGFKLEIPEHAPCSALRQLGDIMGVFSSTIESRGGMLCLLLDEVQAPLLNAVLPADAAYFASKLKAIATACESNSLVVLTGSGMVTLLNTLRHVPVNGYCMWDAMQRVELGATPSDAAALAMATQILQHRATSTPPPAVVAVVAPSDLVKWLHSSSSNHKSDPIVSARPALIAYLVRMMRINHSGTTKERFHEATYHLIDKMFDEGSVDAAVALGQLPHAMLAHIARLVHGELTIDMLNVDCAPGMQSRTFREMLLCLCEPQSTQPLKLLPPYSRLFGTLLSADGVLLVRWRGGKWMLDEQLRDRLHFFAEHREGLLHCFPSLIRRISCAVLTSFAGNGVGVKRLGGGHRAPATMAELAGVPAYAAMLALLATPNSTSNKSNNKSWLRKTFDELLASELCGPRSSQIIWYRTTSGFQVLQWLQTLMTHVYLPRASLVEVGLTVSIVDAAVAAAVKECVDASFAINIDGVPVMPNEFSRLRKPIHAGGRKPSEQSKPRAPY